MQYLTIEQTAQMLNVHTNTVRRMLPRLGAVDIANGKKKRLIRIPERSIELFLRDCAIIAPTKKERGNKRCATC